MSVINVAERDNFEHHPHEKTVNQEPVEEFSNFGDGACGEPEFPQHLVLDFTPDPEIDNDIVQKKISDFWAFINSTPEIKNLMVEPERSDSSKSPTSVSVKYQPKEKVVDLGATAWSMLDAIEQKGLLTRTFEAKLPKSYCPLGSQESEDSHQKEIREQGNKEGPLPVLTHPVTSKTGFFKKPLPLRAKILCKKLEEWDAKHPNEAIITPPPGGVSNPKPLQTFSVFGDTSCGEPLLTQHVLIDFTPNETDTDFIQKKVCSFWQFINDNPQIQNLKVNPESLNKTQETSDGSMSTTPGFEPDVVKYYQSEDNVTDIGKTAWSMLEDIEGKGLIHRTFAMPKTYCSLGSHESEDSYQKEIRKQENKEVPDVPSLSRHPVTSKTCPVKKLPPLRAKLLCKKLEEWDEKHPKSMEPPGHPPALHHCTIHNLTLENIQ